MRKPKNPYPVSPSQLLVLMLLEEGHQLYYRTDLLSSMYDRAYTVDSQGSLSLVKKSTFESLRKKEYIQAYNWDGRKAITYYVLTEKGKAASEAHREPQ